MAVRNGAFEVKNKALAMRNDASKAQFCRLFPAWGRFSSASQIAQWKKQLVRSAPQVFERGGGANGPDPEALTAPLYQEIGRLKMELDFLRKRY